MSSPFAIPKVTFGELAPGDRFCHLNSSNPVFTKLTDTKARIHTTATMQKRTKGYGVHEDQITFDPDDQIVFYPVVEYRP